MSEKRSDAYQPSRGVARAAILVIVLAGTLLRFAGLSHDLDQGHTYHPDTPKQMRAAERYLNGTYYFHIGHNDYDGYPYFLSHLVEWTVRAGLPVVRAGQRLIGLPVGEGWPRVEQLTWVARGLNAVLASLLIYLVYRGARRAWGTSAGLLAALLLAFSPADVAACHYEAGDTPASFFATLAVLMALRLHHDGRTRFLVAGTACAVCAFASKYHGALAGLAVVLAQAQRQPGGWGWLTTRAAWRGWLLMAGVALATVVLAIPSLLIEPVKMVGHIHSFLTYASNFHLPEHIEQGGALGRLAFSLSRNVPVLVEMIGWPVALAFLLTLVPGPWRDRRYMVLAVLPLTYLVIALGLRALSHPVYHTMVTPTLMLAAAALLTHPLRSGAGRVPRAAAGLAVLVATGYLGQAALGEAFYFQQPDTRLVAREWTRENVPAWFKMNVGPYSFRLREFGTTAGPGPAELWTVSSIRSAGPPERGFRLKQFQLEGESLPLFRHPVLDLYVDAGSLLRADYRMPIFPHIASESGSRLVFDPLSGFLRDGKVIEAGAGRPVERIFVREERVEEALAVVRSGVAPVFVRAVLSGRAQERSLGAGEAAVLRFPRVRVGRPHLDSNVLYRCHLEVGPGRARVTWAFTEVEKGIALWQAGLAAEAAPYLLKASAAQPDHPTLAVLARLADALGGGACGAGERAELDRRAAAFAELWTNERVAEVFGMAPAYLDGLPYLYWPADVLRGGVVRVAPEAMAEEGSPAGMRPAPVETWGTRTPSFSLPPGSYALELDYVSDRVPTQVVAAEVRDFVGPPVLSEPLPPIPGQRRQRAILVAPEGLAEGRVTISGEGAGLRVTGIGIRPDVLSTLEYLGLNWRVLAGRPRPGDEADTRGFAGWLAAGRVAAGEGNLDSAVRCWARAAALRPDRVEPVRELAALAPRFVGTAPPAVVVEAEQTWAELRTAHQLEETWAPFGEQLVLNGYRLSATEVARGGRLGLSLYWSSRQPGRLRELQTAWVHFLDESGKNRFQADRPVQAEWNHPRIEPQLRPDFHYTDVPADLPPGRYRIVVGVYEPETGVRLKAGRTELPRHDEGVELPIGFTVR